MNSIQVLDSENNIYSAEITVLKVKTSLNAADSDASYDEFHVLGLVNPVAEQPYKLLSFSGSLFRNPQLSDLPLLFAGVEVNVIYQEKNPANFIAGSINAGALKPTLEILHLDVDWNSTTGINSMVASIQTTNKKLNDRLFNKKKPLAQN